MCSWGECVDLQTRMWSQSRVDMNRRPPPGGQLHRKLRTATRSLSGAGHARHGMTTTSLLSRNGSVLALAATKRRSLLSGGVLAQNVRRSGLPVAIGLRCSSSCASDSQGNSSLMNVENSLVGVNLSASH
jgi:hypothetical protein